MVLWFGPSQDAPAEPLAVRRARTKRAKALCARCPFRSECLASELARPEEDQHGIRGGLTAAERRRLVRSGVRVGGGWAA